MLPHLGIIDAETREPSGLRALANMEKGASLSDPVA
jgi:hypothetical protein